MMFLEEPRSVLILGGGDLYAAEIALQYPSVEQVTLCDHDPKLFGSFQNIMFMPNPS